MRILSFLPIFHQMDKFEFARSTRSCKAQPTFDPWKLVHFRSMRAKALIPRSNKWYVLDMFSPYSRYGLNQFLLDYCGFNLCWSIVYLLVSIIVFFQSNTLLVLLQTELCKWLISSQRLVVFTPPGFSWKGATPLKQRFFFPLLVAAGSGDSAVFFSHARVSLPSA